MAEDTQQTDRLDFGSGVLTIFWFALMVVFAFLAVLEVDVKAQFWLAASLVGLLLISRRFAEFGFLRIVYLGVIAFLSIRYLIWRSLDTLSYEAMPDFIVMILLYSAEVYAIGLGLLGIFVCLEPITRPVVPLPSEPQKLSSVDVLIPTFNESPEILEVTLTAATQIRYPSHKLEIYLLDDGATHQRMTDTDLGVARAARDRAKKLRALCDRLGVHYRSREKNIDHKAGNINAALGDLTGELVAVFDADHVPTSDFLEMTVGHFEYDPNLFLVQTPHFLINADPVEKNLEMFAKMPGENEVFYRLMQRGMDYWNGALFVGSAAVLKRSALEEIGGFAKSTVTEDAETALELHSKGYNSVYVTRPLTSGLAPETFVSFITQRTRWATGMVQVLMLKHPFTRPGLSISQRLCYGTMCLYWLFPYARVVFFLAPTMFLIFGLHIYNANATEFLAYTVPHYFASMRLSTFLHRKVRWPYIATIYETLQSFFSLRAVTKTIVSPRSPQFTVTPKGTHLEEDFISPLAPPFYILFFLLLVAFAAGIYRYLAIPEEQVLTGIVMLWHLLNFLILLACLGALVELRQRRGVPRVFANDQGVFATDSWETRCWVNDVSTGGASLTLKSLYGLNLDQHTTGRLRVYNHALRRYSGFPVEIIVKREVKDEYKVSVKFIQETAEQRAEVIAFVHGDSARWVNYWDSRPKPVGSVQGLSLLVWWGIKHSWRHVEYLLAGFRKTKGVDRSVSSSV